MIPSKLLGKVSGENWVGIVDAVYAVILTLLLIEFPSITEEVILKNSGRDSSLDLVMALGIEAISYLAVFLIIFDIWASHKTLLVDVKLPKLFAKSTGFVLFFVSLIPPVYYIVEHSQIQATLLSSGKHIILINWFEAFAFLLLAIIYFELASIASSENKQDRSNPQRTSDLSYLSCTSASKALIAVSFAGVCFLPLQEFFLFVPPVPILTLALSTYFKINFFSSKIIKRIIQRLGIRP